MTEKIHTKNSNLHDNLRAFVQKKIAGRNLSSQNNFPLELWKKMGKQGFLAFGIPEQYGGCGGGFLSISKACKILVENSCCPGLGASFMVHHLSACFALSGFGTENQKQTYLPGIAKGKITASVAMSEPETGAHPRYMRTTAKPDKGGYLITGEKTYLTNAPFADIFFTMAVSGKKGDKNLITAFIIQKKTPGLSVTAPIHLDFLKPAPHGGIIIKDCSLPESSILGRKDHAYLDIIKPFREIEDVLMMGIGLGAMECQLKFMAEMVKNTHMKKEMSAYLGRFKSIITALTVIAHKAASLLDNGLSPNEVTELVIAFKLWAKNAQDIVDKILSQTKHKIPDKLEIITRDLKMAGSIAANITLNKEKKLGLKLAEI